MKLHISFICSKPSLIAEDYKAKYIMYNIKIRRTSIEVNCKEFTYNPIKLIFTRASLIFRAYFFLYRLSNHTD